MILHTDKLTKDYGRMRALDSLTMSINAGEVVGLLGPNGSGKSTALRIIMGFLRPTAGTASIAGNDCWRASHLARKLVAYLPGELRLYENMTGRQLVAFLSRLRPEADHREPTAMAKQFDIDLSRPLSQLSSGMKRKVALLAVLTPHTPLVILDEPTNTLDPTMRDEFLAQVLEAKKQGQAVLFSSHVLSEVEAVCDRVLILRKGKLTHEQSVKESATKRVRVAFADDAPFEWPGAIWQGRSMAFEYEGDLSELLAKLGGRKIVDLHVEPVGLSGVYRQIHGADVG